MNGIFELKYYQYVALITAFAVLVSDIDDIEKDTGKLVSDVDDIEKLVKSIETEAGDIAAAVDILDPFTASILKICTDIKKATLDMQSHLLVLTESTASEIVGDKPLQANLQNLLGETQRMNAQIVDISDALVSEIVSVPDIQTNLNTLLDRFVEVSDKFYSVIHYAEQPPIQKQLLDIIDHVKFIDQDSPRYESVLQQLYRMDGHLKFIDENGDVYSSLQKQLHDLNIKMNSIEGHVKFIDEGGTYESILRQLYRIDGHAKFIDENGDLYSSLQKQLHDLNIKMNSIDGHVKFIDQGGKYESILQQLYRIDGHVKYIDESYTYPSVVQSLNGIDSQLKKANGYLEESVTLLRRISEKDFVVKSDLQHYVAKDDLVSDLNARTNGFNSIFAFATAVEHDACVSVLGEGPIACLGTEFEEMQFQGIRFERV